MHGVQEQQKGKWPDMSINTKHVPGETINENLIVRRLPQAPLAIQTEASVALSFESLNAASRILTFKHRFDNC